MPLEVTITSVTANTPVNIFVCELDGSNCAYISTVSTFPYTFSAPQCVEGGYFSSEFGYYNCQGILVTGTSGGTGTFCMNPLRPYSGITLSNVDCSVDQTDFIVKIVDTEGCIHSEVELVTPTPTPSQTPTQTITPTQTATQTPTTTTTLTATPTTTTTPTTTPTNTPTPSTTPVWVGHYFGNAWHSTSALALTDYVTYGLQWYTYMSVANFVPVVGAIVYRLSINDTLYNIVDGGNRWRLMTFNNEVWAVQINSVGEIIDYVYGPIQSPTPSVTATVTPTVSITPSNTPSVGSSPTPTETPTQTPTITPSITASQTITPTTTSTMTPTVTQTSTQTQTPTNTPTPSITASPSVTPSETPTTTPTPTKTRFTFVGYSGSTQDEACGSYYNSTIYGDDSLFDENIQFYNNLTGDVDVDMTGYYQYNGVVVQILSGGTAPGVYNLCFTLTPTPTNTSTNTPTPSNTPTVTPTTTSTPTQTPTVTQTVTNTPSISVSPTQTASPTQSIGYYTYLLGTGLTIPDACSDFTTAPNTLYAPISGGVGPNVGEYLYTIAGTPPTNVAPNGFYSNGIGWYEISGGNGQITSADPDGCY
jgi:hypothetical protein